MAYVAVLDANVLHPHISVDLLLRLADRGLFRPAWSSAILEELRDSLTRRNLARDAVERRISSMVNAFPEVALPRLGSTSAIFRSPSPHRPPSTSVLFPASGFPSWNSAIFPPFLAPLRRDLGHLPVR